jgi:hypothetical protein
LAAVTPQFLELTELSCATHLRSSIIFLFFSSWEENISGTLLSNLKYLKTELGS